MPRISLLVFLGMLLLVGMATARAEPAPVLLDGASDSFSLDGHLSFLPDPQGSLEIGEVARSDGFQDVTPHDPGLANGVLWYRFTVRLGPETPVDWVLAFGEPDIDDVRIYVAKPDGGHVETRLGRRIPASQLDMASRLHVATLSLPGDVATAVHVRLSSLHKIRFEEAALWRPAALTYQEARRSALHGISFGMMGVFVLAYVLFGLWLRDTPMLLYAAFVVTAICREATHSGLIPLLLPGAGGMLNYLLSAIGLFGGVAAFMLMWDRMLGLERTFPVMHHLYRWGGVGMLVPILFATDGIFPVLAQAAHPAMLAASIGSIAMAGILVLRRPHDVLLKFYLCAFLPVVLVWGVEVGALLSPVVPLDLGRRMDAAATVIHLGILCLALGYRFVVTRRQQAQAEAALAGERLVRERQRTFVDMVTHEFRTPLAVIDSTAQILPLLVPDAGPEVSGRFTTIRRAVRRMVGLIETCLSGERFEAMELDLQQVSPAEIVIQAVTRDLETGRGEILAHTSTDLPAACSADGALLGIALDALIDNARRYGPSDRPVEVAARMEDGWIAFMVMDRGPGVPPQEAKLIFDKYYRSPSGGSSSGFGIGLYLVRTIATMHGGTVECRARDGGGACMVLRVPAAQPQVSKPSDNR